MAQKMKGGVSATRTQIQGVKDVLIAYEHHRVTVTRAALCIAGSFLVCLPSTVLRGAFFSSGFLSGYHAIVLTDSSDVFSWKMSHSNR
jgi:hypothetical protein